MSHGQSAITVDKERRIAAAMSVGMRIASAKFFGSGYKFWAFDANAGSGWNDSVDVPGSPLVFWKVARECLIGMEPVPFFCDINLTHMTKLQERLSSDKNALSKSILLPGDNEEGVEQFAECITKEENPKYAIGALLVDPNGYFYRNAKSREGAPVNALTWFCREFPRIDLILNMNIRTYFLQKSQHHNVRPPSHVLDSLSRKQWLVARTGGSSRFLLAIGRNITTGDHRSLGLYDRESAMGKIVMMAAEEKRQGSLEYDIPDLPAISSASRLSSRSNNSNAQSAGIVPMRRKGD